MNLLIRSAAALVGVVTGCLMIAAIAGALLPKEAAGVVSMLRGMPLGAAALMWATLPIIER